MKQLPIVLKYGLTKREVEVLQLMVTGAHSKLIAGRLGITPTTIRTHQRAIFEKLRVGSDLEAVIKVFQEGLLEANTIVRSIEFAPEHFQAGVAILSYFGTVLRQKHPHTKATVRIEQDGLAIRLVVVTPDNEAEIIEKTLDEYGLVMSGRMTPAEYLVEPQHIRDLQNKLELANVELRWAQRQIDFEREGYGQRIGNLDEEVHWLRERLSLLLTDGGRDSATAELLGLLRDFQTYHDSTLNTALGILERALLREADSEGLETVREALSTIRVENPKLFERIRDFSVSAASSTAGRILYDLITQFRI